MPYKTVKQMEWRIRAENIGTFKYLEYDSESIFRKRQNIGLKHGFLIGDTGSGKTKVIQREIELILKNTKYQT